MDATSHEDTYSPIEVELTFTVSPDLDIEGFRILSSELTGNHPLYAQLVTALARVNISMPEAGPHGIKENALKQQITVFYTTHAEEIRAHCDRTRERWGQIREKFLDACDELFSHEAFLETKEFSVYPTVWRVYIQQTECRAISFPLDADTHNPDEALYVILHELLHVFFYQYISAMPSLRDRTDLWDTAEIFNNVILSQPRFKEFYPSHTPEAYPMYVDAVKNVMRSTVDDDARSVITYIKDYLDSQNSNL